MNTIEIKKVLLKRGNTAQSMAYTGLLGEVTIDTDLNCLRIHDGVTAGGEIVASTATTIQGVVDEAIAGLLNGAPEALNTLKELADALGNSEDSITDILTTLATKANTADLATVATTGSYNDLSDKPAIPSIEGLATEAFVTDAVAAIPATDLTGLATESYVDSAISGATANTGDITFDNDNIGSTNDVVRLRTLDVNTTASYSFTPGADYSTAVWNNNGITFNDPTQEIYTAIWALTNFSTIEIQVNGVWQTVTEGGSSTPGWPAAPTLWLQETVVDGPLNIDVVDITIRQGTESYVEVDGSDFRVDVQDDIRIYGNDTFRLVNRSADNAIEIETNDGEYTWTFRPDGGLDLPDGGGIYRNGISVIPDLATVATSGSYNDLADTPTIPEPVNLTPGVVGLDVNGFMFYDAGTQTITANWSHYYLTNVHIFKSSLPSDFNTTVDDAWTLNGIPVVSVQTWSSNTDQWEITLASNYDGAQPLVFSKEVAGAYVGLPNGGVLDTADSNIEVRGINNFNIEADNVVNIVTDAQGAGHQWQFGDAGEIVFPDSTTQTTAWTGSYTPTTISSGLTAPGSAVVATADKVNFNFSDMVGTAVSIDRSSRISSPKSDGLTLASNFDVRIIADYTDNDRTWTFNGTDGSLTAPGDITTTGNITAANFTGNISITGDVTGTSANVELVAGSYTWTFDNTGNTAFANGTVSVDSITTGNLTVNGTSNNVVTKKSQFFDQGDEVSLGLLTFTVVDNGGRYLQIRSTGNYTAWVDSVTSSISQGTFSLTTSFQNFPNSTLNAAYQQSDFLIVILSENTAYRVTFMGGAPASSPWNNNFISIEKLL